jgi:hypothetical protein
MAINRMGAGAYDQGHTPVTVNLTSGQLFMVPSGQYQVLPGLYTFLQWWDAATQVWRVLTTPAQSAGTIVSSDGANWRLANLTGTMVGASLTTAGSGLTNGIYPAGTGNGTAASPTVTMSAAGGSIVATVNAIVGGAINTTIAITAGGTGYTRAPVLQIGPPPLGGVPATAFCTVSAGAINAVTVTNQGAGYTVAPPVTVTRAPGDTTGTGGVLTVNATLAGSGGYTALTQANNGAGMTSVPTFTFAPTTGTPAATAIMCFTITTGVAQTAASNLGAGNIGFAIGALATAQSINTNPAITTGLFVPRPAYTAFNTTVGGGVTFLDGGLHQIIPTGIAYASDSNGTISAAVTIVAQTVGGAASDLSYLLPL